MHVGERAIAAYQDTPPDMEPRVSTNDAEPIDDNGMLSRFQCGRSLAPAQPNLQSPLLPALLYESSQAEMVSLLTANFGTSVGR